jgi:hypothetical protein
VSPAPSLWVERRRDSAPVPVRSAMLPSRRLCCPPGGLMLEGLEGLAFIKADAHLGRAELQHLLENPTCGNDAIAGYKIMLFSKRQLSASQ